MKWKVLTVLKNREGSSSFKDAKRAIQEFEVIHKLNHSRICKYLYINTAEPIERSDNTTFAISLEFIDHNLKDLLKKKFMSNIEKAKIALEVAHGMNFLHKRGLVYCDLKVENIMHRSHLGVPLIWTFWSSFIWRYLETNSSKFVQFSIICWFFSLIQKMNNNTKKKD